MFKKPSSIILFFHVVGMEWFVVNLSFCIVSQYRNLCFQINFHINYILHYYYMLLTLCNIYFCSLFRLSFELLARHFRQYFQAFKKVPIWIFPILKKDLFWIFLSMKKDISGSSSSCYVRSTPLGLL